MQRVWHWIETGLRRYPWAITLAVLIPCAYFEASGVNHLLAAQLFKTDVAALTRATAPAPPGGASAASAASAGQTSRHSRDTHEILARNVFDSAAGCLNCAAPAAAEVAAEPGAAAAPVDYNRTPDPCDGQAKITGIVEASNPRWSFVFMRTAENQPPMPYRAGQTIENKTVTRSGWDAYHGAWVFLQSSTGGPLCYYAQFNMPPRGTTPGPPATATAAAPAGPPTGVNGELAAAIEQGIQPAGANEFNVRRSLIDRILENQAELMRTTRIMPQEEGGRVVGVRLIGVTDNSLLGRLGLRGNDVLTRINGLDISTPDRALEAYSRLRTADRITISVQRNGQPVNLDFNIR